jgi:hypothetical protein
MYQPYPSSGQPVGPLRPPAPAPALTAVKLMYAGAAVSAVNLIIGLALIIVLWIVFSLVVIALWLWMARANGQGRNWARILSTVLFGLATLQLRHPQPQGSPAGFGATVLYYGGAALFAAAWLVGAAAVWLLWRPAFRLIRQRTF